MDLRSLIPIIETSLDVEALSACALKDDAEVTIPAPLGAVPALLAAVESNSSIKAALTVVVVPSGRDADDLASSLGAYLPANAVEVFPAWETLPHERLSPRSDTVARRLYALRRLAHPEEFFDELRVLIVPVRALLQPIVAGLGEMEPVRLLVGDVADFAEVQEKLTACAYSRVDMVESRGQFAVRGGIIDVFPPIEQHPLRIEFFGDEVETIRTFAVADQRSMEPRNQVYAPPCREILLSDAVHARAAAALTQFPGAADMLARVAEGIAVEGMESLAPALVESTHSLVQEFPEDTRIVLVEPERVEARAESLLATSDEFLAAAWSAAAAGGSVPLNVNDASFSTVEKTMCEAEDRGISCWRLGGFSGTDQSAANDIHETKNYAGDIDLAFSEIAQYAAKQWHIVVVAEGAGLARRFADQLGEADVPARYEGDLPYPLPRGIVVVTAAPMNAGFICESAQLAVFTAEDIVSRTRRGSRAGMKQAMPKRRKKAVVPLQLKPGDFVVHERHGVGQFVKLAKRALGGPGGAQREYMVIDYASSKRGQPRDQLWVPTDQLDQVSKYAGGDSPSLNKMGGADWAKTKAKARAAIRQIAKELIRLYAQRRATRGFAFSPDTPWQRELEDAFEYIETPDQLSTIDEVKRDMESPEPMDRLISGDVGYGKTEVAVRAAFKAVQDAKQVAVLAPTTLLVQQHVETFRDRYAGFPVRVEMLSRFQTPKETAQVIAGLKDGTVDVVIGTHKLLTGDVRFKDLGLVVIDEEQRFGVEHKETLKQLYPAVDVLAMSATPIPRTLEMAVTGIRQMSTLATPPEERHPILTYVGASEEKQISAAIKRELLREGQVFFVHNRTQSIYKRAAQLADLVPEARIGVAHGQMNEVQLENIIHDFWNKDIDVLVCTTIVETGLDIANANTLIVEDAHKFGLSQLHQLRGRVGRGRERAYAYFLYPPGHSMTETAIARLRTIASHTELGAGIQVALKDLEIRGAGNLLGGEQSGHIAGVGFDLYIRMVGEAVAQLTGQDKRQRAQRAGERHVPAGLGVDGEPVGTLNLAASQAEPVDPSEVRLELPIEAFVPQSWVESERLRLEIYGKIAATRSEEERREVRVEMEDRYGDIPVEVQRLFRIAALRELAAFAGVEEMTIQGRFVRFAPVELPDSRQVRVRRLYPRAVTKAAVRSMLVPIPSEGSNGGFTLGGGSEKLGGGAEKPVTNEEMFEFIEDFIKKILL